MRILNRYLLSSLVTTFTLTLVVVTFIMCLGGMFQISDLLAKGVSAGPLATIFLSGIPVVLAFAVPISCVTATLLVFERLSADGEVTAMRACGISLGQMAARPLMFAALLSAFCLFIHTSLASTCHFIQRRTIHRHREQLTRAFLEPGRFVHALPGFAVYVGRSRYEAAARRHAIEDVILYDRRSGGSEREIRAARGYLEVSADRRTMTVFLGSEGGTNDAERVRVDPLVPGRTGMGFMENYRVVLDLAESAGSEYRKRMADLTAAELIDGILSTQKPDAYRMALRVELNQRIVLSLSCFCFVLLGIPFGITTRRTSSSIGIAISLVLVFSFYLVIILVDSLARRPEWRPDLIMWSPVAGSLGLGALLFRRIR